MEQIAYPANPNNRESKQSDDEVASSHPPVAITLPKGGGAISGIGEKFAANPVTLTVPIATSPGRAEFGPELTLSYDSGAGNGPFGFGWSLSLPAITRKTDKGLLQYHDTTESDVLLLSGAEDLVPEFEKWAPEEGTADPWIIEDGKHVVYDKPRTVNGITYRVRRYRTRIEGLFARIERWTHIHDPEDVHWRAITRDNHLSLYGKDMSTRIADPEDPRRIFSWALDVTETTERTHSARQIFRSHATQRSCLSP